MKTEEKESERKSPDDREQADEDARCPASAPGATGRAEERGDPREEEEAATKSR